MRRLGATLAATALLSAAFASAASLGVSSQDLGAGSATVQSCDTAFTISYTTSADRVTDVTVSDIADPACEGGRLEVTLTGTAGKIGGGGPATVPTDGDTTANAVSVAIPEQPLAADVDGVHVVVTGP